MIRSFDLGILNIPLLAAYDLRCNFASRQRETIHPMGDGSLLKQVFAGTNNKLRIELTGAGNIPPGLDGLDYTTTLLFKSGAERSIVSTLTSITIPSERRTEADYLPWGRALVGLQWQPTPVIMTVDQADLTPVAGATQYQVLWYPEFYVLSEGGGPDQVFDVHGASVSWSIGLLQV